jgi:hypothetical protein
MLHECCIMLPKITMPCVRGCLHACVCVRVPVCVQTCVYECNSVRLRVCKFVCVCIASVCTFCHTCSPIGEASRCGAHRGDPQGPRYRDDQ